MKLADKFREMQDAFEKRVRTDDQLLAVLWDVMQGRLPYREWQMDYMRKEIQSRGLLSRWEAMLKLKQGEQTP
jgi:hypothetical protein